MIAMALWIVAEAWAVAFIASLLLIAFAVRHLADVVRSIDDVDRRRHVAHASVAEQPLGLFAAELDEIHSLPEREPWERWI